MGKSFLLLSQKWIRSSDNVYLFWRRQLSSQHHFPPKRFNQSPNSNSFDYEFGYRQPSTKEGAYDIAKRQYPLYPCIILVNPFLDQNVGSVARIMLNYGLTELRIVQPRCDIYSSSCEALASGAFEIVKNAKVYNELSDCLSDLSWTIATSDRTRGFTQLVLTPEEVASRCVDFPRSQNGKIGIMFGRESSGLSNEELLLASALVKVPTFNHFSSLNLAQAVNVIGYELYKAQGKAENTYPPNEWLETKDKEKLAEVQDIEIFLKRTLSYLDTRLYQPDEIKKQVLYDHISTMFRRVR